jgi:hypothetical protein
MKPADKAQLVWRAAFPKGEPLTDDAAAALAHKVEWAATFRAVAASTLPPEDRERLQRIQGHADKLAKALAEYPATRDRIEQCWPDFPKASTPPDLRRTRRGIAALRKAVHRASERAKEHPGAGRFLRNQVGSPERIFILRLCRIYKDFSGKLPPQSSRGGPFMRFVQEASQQFWKGDKEVPSPETIHLAAKRRVRSTVK